MFAKIAIIVDWICLILFIFMGIYMFALPTSVQDSLMPAFVIVNPFRTGAWIMGLGFLVTCLWGKARIGLIWDFIMLICYLLTAVTSLVGLMTVTTWIDLLWYFHPILIVLGCIALIVRSIRKSV